MGEQIYIDLFGEEVVLAESTRNKIITKHPYMVEYMDYIERVLQEPDEIRRSNHDERQVLYYRFEDQYLKGKWVIVVVKRIDRNFISSAYPSDRMKPGEVLWKKT